MARIIVLGSSAEFPLPRTKTNRFKDYLNISDYQCKFKLHDDPLCNSAKRGGKNKRTRSCLALVVGKETLLFDAGPDIRYQLKKYHLKPTTVFISHSHPDADYGLRYLKNTPIFSEKLGNVIPDRPIKLSKVEVLPFRVIHSKIAPCVGYKIKFKIPGSKFSEVVYMTDMASLIGVKKYIKDCDILFADGSIMNRNLFGHMAISNQLAVYKKWQLKKIFFTHIGHRTPLHEDLVKYMKGRYKNADVAYDGMVIKL